MNTAIIYIVTAGFGIALGLLLARLAGLSFQTKMQLKEGATARVSQGSLKRAVLSQVNGLIDSEEKREELGRAIEGLVNKEIEKRVSETTQELGKKYEKVIKQKTQRRCERG